MEKPDFSRCTAKATELLYKQDVSGRILNIQELKYDKDIVFDTIQSYCQLTRIPISNFISPHNDILKDGCTICDRDTGCYVVLYNADILHFAHRNWTLAHEVGHIYLGHEKDESIEEIEAHFFASQLFMPEYTLRMMAENYGSVDARALTEIFGVSYEAATKRINTMKKKFCVSATEKDIKIWENQRERIDMYYMCQEEGYDYQCTLTSWPKMKADYERQCYLEICAEIR